MAAVEEPPLFLAGFKFRSGLSARVSVSKLWQSLRWASHYRSSALDQLHRLTSARVRYQSLNSVGTIAGMPYPIPP